MNNNTLLKNIIRKGIELIRRESGAITVTNKDSYPGKTDQDYFTNADDKVQAFYVEELTKLFPDAAVLGEEHGLSTAGKNGCKTLIVMDGLDGTKAFKRRQQYGIGTMFALVEEGQIIAAYLGNVNTGEIIGFGPDDRIVRRERFGFDYTLTGWQPDPNEDVYLQIGKAPDEYPEAMLQVTRRSAQGGFFKQINIMNGSIGTMTARLWCGEVGAMVNEPAYTPWDFAPVHGINKALGLIYLRPNAQGKLEIYEPEMFYAVRQPNFPFEIITRPEYVDYILKTYNR